MSTIANEMDFERVMWSARLVAVIDAWVTHGYFEVLLARGGCSLEVLEGDERALRVTARILANAGLLVDLDDRWALSTTGATLVEKGVFDEAGALSLFRELPQLSRILKEGGPVVDEQGCKKSSTIGVYPEKPEKTREFLEMLYRQCADSARETARWIDEQLTGQATILDLGGGHGRYGAELAALGHQVTLFDLPVCIDVARALQGDQIDYREGDFFSDDLGGEYDAVLASNIVHGLSSEQNERLLTRIAGQLSSGGLVVLKDMFLDEFGLWPDGAVQFGLLMLMYTDRGDSYSLRRAKDWFEGVGLEALTPAVFEGYSLVAARKE